MNIDLAKTITSLGAPLLGSVIGGAPGAAIGEIIKIVGNVFGGDDTKTILNKIQEDQSAAQKLAEIESNNKEKLQEITLQMITQNMSDVNKSIQIEAVSDHWPTYSWRPFIGFMFGAGIAISLVTVLIISIIVIWKDPANALQNLPGILMAEAAIFATVTPILGVASYFRGKMQANVNIPTDNRG